MPNLSQIISVQISKQTKGVNQVGFGTPMILGASNKMGFDLYRKYTDMTGVAADFASTDQEYAAANAIFSQAQTPDKIYIGYKPVATSMAAGLDAIRALAGGDDWYCLILDSRLDQDILDAAAYIQSTYKIFIACSGSAGILTSSSLDIASQLKALNYSRTALIYSGNDQLHPDAAWAGLCLPLTVGSETWKFKTLQGEIADVLTATQSSYAKSKNCNTYETYAGLALMGEGTMVDAEFIDTIRFVDWLQFRIQERIIQKLANVNKIPYTDKGAALIEVEIRAQLLAGEKVGGLVEGSSDVFVPKVSDQNPNDRAIRYMPNFSFQGTLAGAVHKLQIKGTVSV